MREKHKSFDLQKVDMYSPACILAREHSLSSRDRGGKRSGYLPEYLSEYFSEYLREYLSEYLSEHLSEYLSDYLSEYLPDYLSEYLAEYLLCRRDRGGGRSDGQKAGC